MDTAVSFVLPIQGMILKKRMKLVFKKEVTPLTKTAFFSRAQLFKLFLKLTVSNDFHALWSIKPTIHFFSRREHRRKISFLSNIFLHVPEELFKLC